MIWKKKWNVLEKNQYLSMTSFERRGQLSSTVRHPSDKPISTSFLFQNHKQRYKELQNQDQKVAGSFKPQKALQRITNYLVLYNQDQ
jgi:hypothetical protein